ncbi:MAG: hypothetical protein ABJC63_05855 [Gemmatimonadales bacterium]
MAKVRKKWALVVDGVEGTPFDDIPVGAAFFSPDSRHVSYIATRDRKEIAVTDNEDGKPYDGIGMLHPKYINGGAHVMYTANTGDRYFVVIDGKESESADHVGDPVFSANDEHMAYVIKKDELWRVVRDGIEGQPYRSIGNNLVFSKDGKHFLYNARDSLDYVVVDDKPVASKGSIQENSYALSADGLHFAFVARTSPNNVFWVLDGASQKGYDWVSGTPAFNADGSQLAYVAEINRERFVVIGKREGEHFDDIAEFPHFAVDGRISYIAKRKDKQFVVIDTVATPYDGIADFVITNAGHLILMVRQGTEWRAIVDGIKGAPFQNPIGPLYVSDDGRHTAYAATVNDKRLMVIDGVQQKQFDDIVFFSFSSNGKHSLYTGQLNGKSILVGDQGSSPAYDEILTFPSPDRLDAPSFTFVARRGGADIRVTAVWK